MTKWVIMSAEYGTEGNLLKEGWEPFAVTTNIHNTGAGTTVTVRIIWLRKKVKA